MIRWLLHITYQLRLKRHWLTEQEKRDLLIQEKARQEEIRTQQESKLAREKARRDNRTAQLEEDLRRITALQRSPARSQENTHPTNARGTERSSGHRSSFEDTPSSLNSLSPTYHGHSSESCIPNSSSYNHTSHGNHSDSSHSSSSSDSSCSDSTSSSGGDW